jgi:hypothetical protein
MSVRTTMGTTASNASLSTMPHLTPREVDSITAAIGFGDWVGILAEEGPTMPGCGEVVAIAAPEFAEKLTRRDDETIRELKDELERASEELASLTTIIGEVFAEKEPSDWRWKLDDAAYDVKRQLDYALDSVDAL